jgi:hypothetical protein
LVASRVGSGLVVLPTRPAGEEDVSAVRLVG